MQLELPLAIAPVTVPPGTLRYMDVVPVGDSFYYFYEIARPDGAHELRASVVEAG